MPHTTAGAQQNQFASPVSKSQLKKAAEGVVPENTKCNTHWAERNFMNWAMQRNQQVPEDPVPLDLFRSHDAELVCKNLWKFVLETHNNNGQHYPPATIRCLLNAINRIFKENKHHFLFLIKVTSTFMNFSGQWIC